ncbi:hypothetical protein CC1G_05445 [Coprinopsis cinerea okayama7|uniref:Uncharacterized protein n=1 Tax=Coprinopsis cinerea (strain Okayama-7 / 130 / ATCC MYA-4618 / FGSC 9003) TaxID=240176 RepID=A8NQ51_COPC7|nr:hypothetical protein CC1G_05445 [Coprinopsis cinerea okayama7\|eukprot:XP_001835483.1 hypothetical protein CC1G_05445 [Coprinopsis cinerea okayama7\
MTASRPCQWRPSSPPLFEGLTSLEIHDRHPSIASSAAEFLDALGRMSKLEHLHLDIKVPDSNQPATKDRLVALPSLKSLYVEGSLSESIDFMEHVVVPGSAKADVSVVYATGRDGRQSAPEGSSLQPRILKPSDTNPPSGSNPREIAFTRSNPTSVIIDTDVDTCGTMRIRENMDLFTVILTSERYGTLTDGGRAVLASLPSTDIRSLAIRLFPREECFKLDELLPVLQSVEELWVGEADGSLVIHTPLEDPCLFYGSQYPVQFLPALKVLVFERVSILSKDSPCINLQYRDGDFVVPPVVFGDLMNLLKLRAHIGYKISKLQFGVADNLTAAQVEELETVVEEVVWSGVEKFRNGCGSEREDCPCKGE